MTVFEALKNVKEFRIGDIVLWNGTERLEIVGLPTFYHRIYYGNGSYDDVYENDHFYGSKYKTQEVLGYLVKDDRGVVFRLHLLADLKLQNYEEI
jgi:hypothetical protein